VTQAAVYGVLSLIFWALIVIVTLKTLILLRANTTARGGTLTLMALAQRALWAQHARFFPARSISGRRCSMAMR